MTEPTHFAVFRHIEKQPLGQKKFNYVISTGTRKELEHQPGDYYEIAKIRRIPKPFLKEVQEIAKARKAGPS
ncbi:MAG: hypothetical protein V1811_02755, partial [Candidatus Micrarchaeota archaeon]